MNYKMRSICITLMTLVLGACTSADELQKIEIAGFPLDVEIAADPETRAKGLMKRRRLADNRGMLFIFESESQHSFWMKNTFIPLSLAFIAADGTIRQIEKLHPQSLDPVTSSRNVLFAIEVNQGWFEERGIQPGDKVRVRTPQDQDHRYRLPGGD